VPTVGVSEVQDGIYLVVGFFGTVEEDRRWGRSGAVYEGVGDIWLEERGMEDGVDVHGGGDCQLEGNRVDLFCDLEWAKPAVVELWCWSGGFEVTSGEPDLIANLEGDALSVPICLVLGSLLGLSKVCTETGED
jgi:hypothetical protein